MASNNRQFFTKDIPIPPTGLAVTHTSKEDRADHWNKFYKENFI